MLLELQKIDENLISQALGMHRKLGDDVTASNSVTSNKSFVEGNTSLVPKRIETLQFFETLLANLPKNSYVNQKKKIEEISK